MDLTEKITEIKFKWLKFVVHGDKIDVADGYSGGETPERCNFAEVNVAGDNKPSHMGVKLSPSSEGSVLKYVSHEIKGDALFIVQKSDKIEAVTEIKSYEGTSALRVNTTVKNISEEDIVLEGVSSFCLPSVGKRTFENAANSYFTVFNQSHHYECQPSRRSFFDYGFTGNAPASQKKISFANVGSWSTKEALPQGIVESGDGNVFMFQIESNNSWYFELSDIGENYYLWLGGATTEHGSWYKTLKPKVVYKSINAVISKASTVSAALDDITVYRRAIAGKNEADENLPVIFNAYMHLDWDSPDEERTKVYARSAAELGAKYYVIDCGWHNEEPGNEIYPYVGQWKESKTRFPHGLRATTDFIRSLGMKAGLWIEPEIIGQKCEEMLAFYGDDCFLRRHGKKIGVMNRYFLDYSNPKVYNYMFETIRRMVEDYGADYIKLDYNQDIGVGADGVSESFGEGLEVQSAAYFGWADDIRKAFPDVIFETCSSGGMRMDYATLSHFSLVSSSDQTDYKKYPYIVANFLAAVLPEQGAVWSYPVDGYQFASAPATYEKANESTSRETVIMNMINTFLGRMHLASHIDLLSEDKRALIKEGVKYYDFLTPAKKIALPFLPCGFARFGDEHAAAGLKTERKAYLSVYCLGKPGEFSVCVGKEYKKAICAYPKANELEFSLENGVLTVKFTEDFQARFFELEI